MSWFTTRGVEIIGMAASVSNNKIDEAANKNKYGEDTVNKFIKNTGIRERFVVTLPQTASDLGVDAANRLLNALDIKREEIGVLLYVTLSPDYRRPATSTVMQMRLGLSNDCSCMDIGHGCAGFLYGHQVMMSLLSQCESMYGLVILGDNLSVLQNPDEYQSMMFGDAASAVIYRKSSGCTNNTLLKTDGSGYRSIFSPGGGFKDLHGSLGFYMDGMSVFQFATSEVLESIREYLIKTNSDIDQYDFVAFHQANKSILRILTKEIGADEERVGISLDRYGNTSGSSIPLTICDRYGYAENGKLNVLAVGFGVGLAWGVTSYTISSDRILPIARTDELYI